MAQQNDTGFVTLTSGEALAAFRNVKVKSGTTTDPVEVVYADSGERGSGITQDAALTSGDPVVVKLWNAPGTFKVCVAGAVARGAALYPANDGKMNDVAAGEAEMVAMSAGTADGSIVEAIWLYNYVY